MPWWSVSREEEETAVEEGEIAKQEKLVRWRCDAVLERGNSTFAENFGGFNLARAVSLAPNTMSVQNG